MLASPNCGANFFLQDKEYIKVIPLEIPLWDNIIKKMIDSSLNITNEERKQISDQFSVSKSINQFSFLIRKIINR